MGSFAITPKMDMVPKTPIVPAPMDAAAPRPVPRFQTKPPKMATSRPPPQNVVSDGERSDRICQEERNYGGNYTNN